MTSLEEVKRFFYFISVPYLYCKYRSNVLHYIIDYGQVAILRVNMAAFITTKLEIMIFDVVELLCATYVITICTMIPYNSCMDMSNKNVSASNGTVR